MLDNKQEKKHQVIPDYLIDKTTFQLDILQPNLEEKWEIVKQYYDYLLVDYLGVKETLWKILLKERWSGIHKFVRNYIKKYEYCQQYKIIQCPLKAPLQEIPVFPSNRLFSQVSIDLITDLPSCKGKDTIFSIINHSLSKAIILAPITKKAGAKKIASLLINILFEQYGLSNKVILDQDP